MSERWRIEPGYFTKVDPSLGLLGSTARADHRCRQGLGARRCHARSRVLAASSGAGHRRRPDRHARRHDRRPERDSTSTFSTGSPRAPSLNSCTISAPPTTQGPSPMWASTPDVVIECTGVGSVIVDSIRHVGAGGVVCLTGVGSGGGAERPLPGRCGQGAGPAEQRRRGLGQRQPAALLPGGRGAGGRRPGMARARLITRRVPPQNIADALKRGPDDIKVVVDFGG